MCTFSQAFVSNKAEWFGIYEYVPPLFFDKSQIVNLGRHQRDKGFRTWLIKDVIVLVVVILWS